MSTPLPAPELLCEYEASLHSDTRQPPAVVICSESSGIMRTMRACGSCAPHYAMNAASLALHDAAGAVIVIVPLPGGEVTP